MAVNKYQPHVLVIPEDEADRQIANGFLLDQSLFTRRIQILEEAGGWVRVLDQFESDHIAGMESWPGRFMVLIIDFDGNTGRLAQAMARIPTNLADRVFVLGSLTDPEDLRRSFGKTFEEIGTALAEDCREDTNLSWGHNLLQHNSMELNRLRTSVRPFLFATG
jgi:hypothetical protein